jgi:YidC/Oxa1 family membrane protein insertase
MAEQKSFFSKDNIPVVVILVLLVGWFPLMWALGVTSPPWAPKPPPTEAPAPAVAAPSTAPSSAPVAVPAPGTAAASVPVAVTTPVNGETVEVGNADFKAAIDWKNGLVSSVKLLKHMQGDRKTPICLECAELPPGWLHTAAGGLPGAAKLVSHDATRVVTERVLPDQNLTVRQEWSVSADMPYKLDCRVTLVNRGAVPAVLADWRLGGGAVVPTAEELQGGFGMPATLSVDVAFTDAERSKAYQAKKIRDPATGEELNRAVRWSAVHSKYFVLFVGGTGREFSGIALHAAEIPAVAGKTPKTDRLAADLALAPLTVAPGAEQALAFSVYAGPKEYTLLRKLNGGVESILQMDMFMFPGWHVQWMGKISRFILQGMIGVKTMIGPVWAYGLAIILITLLVKLLFWPLTHFSTVSMKRMSQVQPLIKEINEKYKENAQLKQQKVMELYKEHKINPMMGCLPMLLQIPVFFALYNVFRCAVELRHANFLWVHDLSQPDTLAFLPYADIVPVRPLAILTIVTMFLQQKLTPSSMDPTQAKMMMFMTLFFAFIFYGMPSGLTLYWTVNQAIGIVQMLVTYKLVKDLHLPHLHHAKKA